MEQKIVRGYFRNKKGIEVEGEYTMSKSLTMAVKRVEEDTGLKVSEYKIVQESPKEVYEWCLIEGEGGAGEVENVELINYFTIEEELIIDFGMAMTFTDGVCLTKEDRFYQDIAFEEKFLKLLEE